ncbi:MAG: HAF repeat-containing protein [Planctomycetota bacterium]
MKTFIRITVSLAVFALVAQSQTLTADITYSVTEIGTLPGTSIAFARDINDRGEIVGDSRDASTSRFRAWVWDDGTMTPLGDLPGGAVESSARSINNSGQITGYSASSTGNRAFLWQSGSMSNLGTMSGASRSEAYGINNHGHIVGESNPVGVRGFYRETTVMQDIGFLPGGLTDTTALGINDSSQVVGNSSTTSGGSNTRHAFRWEGGSMTDLGTLVGDTWSSAEAINASGDVVGYSRDAAASHFSAFLWSGGSMIDLGELAGGLEFSYANDINNSGVVVGESRTADGLRAFVWDSTNGMRDLNTLLDGSGSGWTLVSATGINRHGQIVGYGINPAGLTQPFLLSPPNVVPEPGSAMVLAAFGSLMLRRRKR